MKHRKEMIMERFRILTMLCIGLMVCPMFGPAAIAEDQRSDVYNVNRALYEVKKGETLEELAKRFVGGDRAVTELMEYNRIKDPAVVKEGFILVLPGTERTEALIKIESAKEALALAREAMAEVYAPEEYKFANGYIEEGETNLHNGNYDKATALGELGRARAIQAKELADARAVIQQPAKVTAVNGSVDISQDGERTWRPVTMNEECPVKAVIRTGKASRAELTLGDGSVIQVQESTKMVINNFKLDQRNQKRQSEMQIYLGNILGKVAQRQNEQSTFQVHSRSTVLAIRGTDLRVGTDLVETTRLSVLDGNVVATARKKEVPVPGNNGTFVEPGEAPRKPIELLPPPAIGKPATELFSTSIQTIDFEWEPVRDGAAAQVSKLVGNVLSQELIYHLEIAKDLSFNYVVQEVRTPKTYWTCGVLEPGDYYWQVSTIDKNGLEGPSSPAQRLRVIRDLDVVLRPAIQPAVRGTTWIVGPTNMITVVPVREQSSIAGMIYNLNNGGFMSTDGRILFHEDGDYLLKVRAVGADGYMGEHIEQQLIVDTRGPRITPTVSPVTQDPEMGDVVFVTFDVADENGVETIEYRINESAYEPYSGRLKVAIASQYFGIHVQAINIYGKPFLDKYFKPAMDVKIDCHAVDVAGNHSMETLKLNY